jgi:hypothetical protein
MPRLGRWKLAVARDRIRPASAIGNCAMPVRARPLSPHLEVYRWQIGNTLSILHRITGVALAFGIVALATGWSRLPVARIPMKPPTVFRRSLRPRVLDRLDLFVPVSPIERHTPSLLGCGIRLRAHPAAYQRLGGGAGRAVLTACVWARCGTERIHEPANSLGPRARTGLGEGRHRRIGGCSE